MRAFRRRAAELGTVLGLVATAVTALPVPAAHAATAVCPPFAAISAGSTHSLALADDGTVWAWGSSGNALGNPASDGSVATAVHGLADVVAVSAGGAHSLAIRADGSVYAWGNNVVGQLGDGTTTSPDTPVRVNGLPGPATAVAAGGSHSLALVGGRIYAWGWNNSGQLGDGTTVTRTEPVPVGTGQATSIAAGYDHSMAVIDGELSSWGGNHRGQLGASSTVDRTTPGPVRGTVFATRFDGAVTISAGVYHSHASLAGVPYGWGANDSGQVGDGTVTDRHSPARGDATAAGATTISAGGRHSLALARSGVLAWGANSYGQLGDGTQSGRTTPVLVTALPAGVSQVAAGYDHSLALVGGLVKAWGRGGALGDGGAADSAVPVDVRCSPGATLVALSDAPDPAVANSAVTFTARWTTASPETQARLLVCRTPLVSNGACVNGEWAAGSLAPPPAATAVRQTSTLDVGTHDYYGFLCDAAARCGSATHGSFTVTAGYADTYVSDACDVAGTNVVSGFVTDGAYVKLRTQPAPDTGAAWVCVAAQSGSAHVGGRLVVDGVSASNAVGVDEDAASVAACAANANNVPVQSGTVLGGQPYWIHATPSPVGSSDAAWVCVRFTASLGFRLRFAPGAAGTATSFVADPPTRSMPPYATGVWPSVGPSATCANAVSGQERWVDLVVGDTRVALYTWTDATRTHICVRGGGAGGAGGRLTVDAAGAPSLTSGTTTAPCPFDVVTRSDAPSYGVYVSDPASLPAVPVSACVTVAGSARSVTLDYSGAAVATWSPDPA